MDNENVRILLAGFRSGFLVVIRYILSEDGDFQAISTVSRLIGTTPVTVSRDANHPLSALISCESKLYRLVLDSDSSTRMTRAWILGGQGAVIERQSEISDDEVNIVLGTPSPTTCRPNSTIFACFTYHIWQTTSCSSIWIKPQQPYNSTTNGC